MNKLKIRKIIFKTFCNACSKGLVAPMHSQGLNIHVGGYQMFFQKLWVVGPWYCKKFYPLWVLLHFHLTVSLKFSLGLFLYPQLPPQPNPVSSYGCIFFASSPSSSEEPCTFDFWLFWGKKLHSYFSLYLLLLLTFGSVNYGRGKLSLVV